MNPKKLLALWGLKWNPFAPELPCEGLLVTPRIEHFAWRVNSWSGGLRTISGVGTGKSVACGSSPDGFPRARRRGGCDRRLIQSSDSHRAGGIFTVATP
jgi:hypothetical protein